MTACLRRDCRCDCGIHSHAGQSGRDCVTVCLYIRHSHRHAQTRLTVTVPGRRMRRHHTMGGKAMPYNHAARRHPQTRRRGLQRTAPKIRRQTTENTEPRSPARLGQSHLPTPMPGTARMPGMAGQPGTVAAAGRRRRRSIHRVTAVASRQNGKEKKKKKKKKKVVLSSD